MRLYYLDSVILIPAQLTNALIHDDAGMLSSVSWRHWCETDRVLCCQSTVLPQVFIYIR